MNNKNNYIELDFQYFPPILGYSINIPKNTLFYKSCDMKCPILSNRPSFFGTHNSSSNYISLKNRELCLFKTKTNLSLLDIRYVKHILNEIIIERKSNDKDIIFGYMVLALSFGLCSLSEQIKLYKMRYKTILKNDERYDNIIKFYNKNNEKSLFEKIFNINPLEIQGIRIGETNNDVESIIILKKIFNNSFDGIICPSMESPYHHKSKNSRIPGEIILFSPKNILKKIKKNILNISKKNIIDLLHENNIFPVMTSFSLINNNLFYYHIGGDKNQYDNKINIDDECDKYDAYNTYDAYDERNEMIDIIYNNKKLRQKISKIEIYGEKIYKLLNFNFKKINNTQPKIYTYKDYYPTQEISDWESTKKF